MSIVEDHQGIPSWFTLNADHETYAWRFYNALLGWEDEPQPRTNHREEVLHWQTIDGRPVASIIRTRSAPYGVVLKPGWSAVVAASDIDAVAANARPLGGGVLSGPHHLPGLGCVAVILAPTFQGIGLRESGDGIGSQRIGESNTVAWAELATDDPEGTAAFFRDLLGVRFETVPQGKDEPPYHLIFAGENAGAGIVQKGTAGPSRVDRLFRGPRRRRGRLPGAGPPCDRAPQEDHAWHRPRRGHGRSPGRDLRHRQADHDDQLTSPSFRGS